MLAVLFYLSQVVTMIIFSRVCCKVIVLSPQLKVTQKIMLNATNEISYNIVLYNGVPLTSGILGHNPPASHHIMSKMEVLISGPGRDDWCSIDSVDVPIKQRAFQGHQPGLLQSPS